jgi:hypothetical protein
LANEPLPWQLTVGRLRAAISSIPDEVVVSIVTQPTTPRHDDLTLFLNVEVNYAGGPLFKLIPREGTSSAEPVTTQTQLRIVSAGNVVAPAVLALESQGFVVTCDRTNTGEAWTATRGDLCARGDDPIQVLGLVRLIQLRGDRWRASDVEVDDVIRRFELG